MKIQVDVQLKDKNWFKTGGSAQFYCTPKTPEEFSYALTWAHENNKEITVLGEGANTLISDDGIEGLVIRPHLNKIQHTTDTAYASVQAGAGTSIDTLICYCLENNLIGLEEFSGIPGTIGGAVYNNLHYFQHSLEHFLVHATVIEKKSGSIHNVDNRWFKFGYDNSKLHEKKYFLINATFNVKHATDLETAYAQGRKTEIIRHRINRYPSKNTCGCFFRNFNEHEVSREQNGKKIIHVAYYLDKLGIKGTLRIGDAIVSHQHANMIVNLGHATSYDIITLAHKMQELVKNEYDIVPQPECELLGFKKYPLIQINKPVFKKSEKHIPLCK